MDAKRGYVPEDDRNFSPGEIEKMRTASRDIAEYSGAAEPPFRRSEYRKSGTAYRQIYS